MSPIDQALLDEWQADRKAWIKKWVAEESERIREARARLQDLAEILDEHKPKAIT